MYTTTVCVLCGELPINLFIWRWKRYCWKKIRYSNNALGWSYEKKPFKKVQQGWDIDKDIINFVTPIRKKILTISEDTEYLRKVAKQGAEKARESASKTLKEVRKIIGFREF